MRYEGEEMLGMSKKEVDKQLKTQKEQAERKAIKFAMNKLDYVGMERQRVEDLFYWVYQNSKALAISEFKEKLKKEIRIYRPEKDYRKDLVYKNLVLGEVDRVIEKTAQEIK